MARNYLILQYHNKPKALGTINALYAMTDEIFKTVLDIADVLNINKAKGYALDLIGLHVGMSRILNHAVAKQFFGFLADEIALGFNIGKFYRYDDSLYDTVRLDDDDYRFFLKAKIMKNFQDGTLANSIHSIQYLLSQASNVIDNQNMTMNIIVDRNLLNTIKLYAIKYLDILVRPVGVKYQFIVITNQQPFGFYHDKQSFGFDNGTFIRLEAIGH